VPAIQRLPLQPLCFPSSDAQPRPAWGARCGGRAMTADTALRIHLYRRDDHERVVALTRHGLAAAGAPADADVYFGALDDVPMGSDQVRADGPGP
jgi:hypothetical protein